MPRQIPCLQKFKILTILKKPRKYFGQVYKDLTAHAETEEQVVYPAMRSYYDNTQRACDEQAEMKRMLEEIKSTSPSAPEFMDKVRQLAQVVQDHVGEEKTTCSRKFATISVTTSKSKWQLNSSQLRAKFRTKCQLPADASVNS